MTPEEMRDTVKESRDLAEVFRTIADIIEQKILPADWRCADAESEENDAQPDGESRLTRRRRFCKSCLPRRRSLPVRSRRS